MKIFNRLSNLKRIFASALAVSMMFNGTQVLASQDGDEYKESMYRVKLIVEKLYQTSEIEAIIQELNNLRKNSLDYMSTAESNVFKAGIDATYYNNLMINVTLKDSIKMQRKSVVEYLKIVRFEECFKSGAPPFNHHTCELYLGLVFTIGVLYKLIICALRPSGLSVWTFQEWVNQFGKNRKTINNYCEYLFCIVDSIIL